MKENLKCLMIGDCYKKEYRYTFLYDNKKYETNDCHSLNFNSNICYVDNKEFINVSYTRELIKSEHVYGKGLLHYYFPILIVLFCFICFKIFISIYVDEV